MIKIQCNNIVHIENIFRPLKDVITMHIFWSYTKLTIGRNFKKRNPTNNKINVKVCFIEIVVQMFCKHDCEYQSHRMSGE